MRERNIKFKLIKRARHPSPRPLPWENKTKKKKEKFKLWCLLFPFGDYLGFWQLPRVFIYLLLAVQSPPPSSLAFSLFPFLPSSASHLPQRDPFLPDPTVSYLCFAYFLLGLSLPPFWYSSSSCLLCGMLDGSNYPENVQKINLCAGFAPANTTLGFKFLSSPQLTRWGIPSVQLLASESSGQLVCSRQRRGTQEKKQE